LCEKLYLDILMKLKVEQSCLNEILLIFSLIFINIAQFDSFPHHIYLISDEKCRLDDAILQNFIN